MKFRQRIWMVPLAAALVFFCGGAASFLVGHQASQALDRLGTSAYPFKEAMDRFALGVDGFRAAVQAAAVEGDPAKFDEARTAAEAARAALAQLQALAAHAGTGALLSQALADYEAPAVQTAQAISTQGEPGQALQRMNEAKKRLDDATEQARQQAAEAVATAQAEAQSGVDRGQLVLLVTGLVTLAALGTASWLIVHATWRQLGDEPETLRELVQRIAGGDLAPLPLEAARQDGSLRAALAGMLGTLRQTVSGIREGADTIAGASVEIAAGNVDLSQRTERASASLQQTASAMAQMTATVRQTALSAVQASSLAHEASGAAQRGGELVSGVVHNMDEIAGASARIGEIIGVIDGIAFQTNILALNAAVEAARAGDHGRGFAVVAAEVRSLAQRSALAAREIKGLIQVSSEKVEGGSRRVRDTGEAMHDIVSRVQRVTDIIGEITTAATEQSSGIESVNTSVGQLDEMTQQNAALVEQSAAAAASLKDQAGRLADVVRTFRVAQAG